MPRSQGKWTIMVYMAGGENVRDAARDGLLQMKEIGSTRNLNILAQFDTGSEGMPTRPYRLTRLQKAAAIRDLIGKFSRNVFPIVLSKRPVGEIDSPAFHYTMEWTEPYES